MIRTALSLLACLIVGVGLARAQAIAETEFWRLLEQTDQALAQPQTALEPLRQRWASVDALLVDGASTPMDVTWINDALASDDAAQRQQLRRYIRALLDYHAQQANHPTSGASLLALDRILSDARFHYAQAAPTPLPTAAPDQTPPPSAPETSPPSLPAQLILIAAGVLLVIGVVSYFARTLQVQTVELPANADGEPETFDDARQRAATLEAARDYRAAVRYLYLSSLLLLDEREMIRYDSSLTNREHLRQVAAKPQLFDALRHVIDTFEDVWYGFRPVDSAFYEQYRRAIDQLRRLVS